MSEIQSNGNPQFATWNLTRAVEVINDTSMMPKPKYEEECVSEIVNKQPLSSQNESFSVNYDEEIFEDAEFVKIVIANIYRSDNKSEKQNRVSDNQNCPSILNTNRSFERLGNLIGVEYNENASPNYGETSVAGFPMNRFNPFSSREQNDQRMFENAYLWNTTPILPIQENGPNCILRNSSLNSVKTDNSISSIRNQICSETAEEKQVLGYKTTSNINKFTANNKIHFEVEDYSHGRGFYNPEESLSTEHFPLFNDSTMLGYFGAQVKGYKSSNCMNIPRKMCTSETLFICKICRKPFSLEANLNEHMLIHSEDKLHSCGRCGKIFERKEDVQAHICMITRNKRYKCDYCEKKFKSNAYLQRHIRTHTGEKPYKCGYCGKTFILKWNKETHTRTHTGEKPYESEYCEMTFNQRGHLKRHTSCHTGEKPYKCEYCGKTFTRKDKKHIHIRTHTGEKPYKCGICGRAFAHMQTLKLHKCIQKGG